MQLFAENGNTIALKSDDTSVTMLFKNPAGDEFTYVSVIAGGRRDNEKERGEGEMGRDGVRWRIVKDIVGTPQCTMGQVLSLSRVPYSQS